MDNIVTETNLKAVLAKFMAEREKYAAKFNQVINGRYNGSKDQVELIAFSIDKITKAETNATYVQEVLAQLLKTNLQNTKEKIKKKDDNPT